MNYGTCKSTFESYLNRSDHQSALSDTFFELAMRRVHRQLKIPMFEKKVTLTAGSASDFTIPSDYLSLRGLSSAEAPLTYKPRWAFLRLSEDGGDPLYYTREAGKWLVKAAVAAGYTLTCLYHASTQALVNNSDEPSLLVQAPDLVIWGALCAAADYYEDESRGARWEAKFAAFLEEVYFDGLDRAMEAHLAIEPATSCPY